MPFSDEVHKLWFVTAISNAPRYKSRIRLYEAFRLHLVNELQANLITVELAYGSRDHELTHVTTENDIHVKVRGNDVLWHKENLLNIGLQSLPDDCKYVCWIDSDIRFSNTNILSDLVHALQIHHVVMPWSHCIDEDPHGGVMQVNKSFAYCHKTDPASFYVESKPGDQNVLVQPKCDRRTGQAYRLNRAWHTGYAVAFRRGDLEKMNGFFDYGAAGSGDHHMLMAIYGQVAYAVPPGMSDDYLKKLFDWQNRALQIFKKDIGVVHGTIHHGFHGFKNARGYNTRWQMLTRYKFSPSHHLKKNLQGVYEWTDLVLDNEELHEFRREISDYFYSRNEDTLVK